MKIIDNEKGFKVIAIDRLTLIEKLSSFGLCDSCNSTPQIGYWVAVLNCWLCPECYKDWYDNATNYPEDHEVENMHFKLMKQILGL